MFGYQNKSDTGNPKSISADEAQQILQEKADNVLLVDVREYDEWDAGHIPGALHIPLSQFASRTHEVLKNKEQEVVVYCLSGGRSAQAAMMLADMGHPSVSNLQGGISAWYNRGGEIVTD